jgi:hypothetical protein
MNDRNRRIARPLIAAARRLLWACLAALPLVFGSALAHEGHDDTPASRAPTSGLAPRVAAASPDIELLAELRHDTLLIYLDRYATNEPLSGATIEVEEGANRGTAAPVGEGLYQASAPWLARPGRHALVFTVHAKDLDDLLNGTLEVLDQHDAGDRVAQSGFTTSWKAYAAAAGMLLLFAGVFMARRRRQRNHGRQT